MRSPVGGERGSTSVIKAQKTPTGYGSPDDWASGLGPEHDVTICAWCDKCLHCYGSDECWRGTDGMHYWPPRDEIGEGWHG